MELLELPVANRAIFVKKRYLAGRRKLFKVNVGRPAPLEPRAVTAFLALFDAQLDDHDKVIVTDFGYGLFSHTLTERMSALCHRRNVPYFADVSENPRTSILKFKGPALVTPNENELRLAFGERNAKLAKLAARYYEETGAHRLVITRGHEGAVYFSQAERCEDVPYATRLPVAKTTSVDSVGAGDVFLATMGLLLGSRLGMPETLYLAGCCASVHVGRIGNQPVYLEELYGFLQDRRELASPAG